MNIASSTSSIIRKSILPSSALNKRVLGEGEGEIQKAGFYVRDSSFLIDEGFNFIVTEANEKFILDFGGKRTVDGYAEITDKENVR